MKHIINWDPRASTLVRGCKEPYVISEKYKNRVDQGKQGFNRFSVWNHVNVEPVIKDRK